VVPHPLRAAHAGYAYQDLVAALACCDVLAEGSGEVLVETSRFEGDRFDDIVVGGDPGVRIQVKHRDGRPELSDRDFSRSTRTLPIEHMITTIDGDAKQLRVISTWTTPTTRPAWLVESGLDPIFPGLRSTVWRLDGNVIWPADGDPIWHELKKASRDDLISFCERFAIELDCAEMSTRLDDPGTAELTLLSALSDRVGVDRAPNNRLAADVAGRLIAVCEMARGRESRELPFGAIASELGLRIDRGRIAQAYPLNPDRVVDRTDIQEFLQQQARNSRRTALVGPPGAGKSWQLELLAEALQPDAVVARHYCFLEPGDPDAQARVALRTMSGNLISELLDDEELTECALGLGGDLNDLQRLLRDASSTLSDGSNRPLVLIVDGLDHVARVDVDTSSPRDTPSDFVAALDALDLPDGCSLIVGSQPGDHLNPLFEADAVLAEIPPFNESETEQQMRQAGIAELLTELQTGESFSELAAAVHAQTAGNPLYCGFLITQVSEDGFGDEHASIAAAIGEIARPSGDLDAYYDYLLGSEDTSVAGVIAEHLAVVDFAVTLDELSEILPTYGTARLAEALTRLRPVLTSVSTQGGLRVYHESLRRHMIAKRGPDPRIGVLLEPVIRWLGDRDFFTDARAYRHLLPSLRRAGDLEAIRERVGVEFVSQSVVHFQPHRAVEANLAVAASLAAERRDFAFLARLSELRRASDTAYAEKLHQLRPYAQAFIELFGAQALADQLLYDGRPAFSRRDGLTFCDLIDRAGQSAPWREYMAAGDERSYVHDPDADLDENLAELRAMVRLDDPSDFINRAQQFLSGEDDPDLRYLDALAQAAFDCAGTEGLQTILDQANEVPPLRLVPFVLLLIEAVHLEQPARATEFAGRLGEQPLSSRQLTRLNAAIVLPDPASRFGDPQAIAGAVVGQDYVDSAGPVRRLRAGLPVWAEAGVDLDPVRELFAGVGWYRGWLRFLVDLAQASTSAQVLEALRHTADDIDPFAGQIRASDVYHVRDEISATYAEALSRLDAADLPAAVDFLLLVSRGTTVAMSRHSHGPLALDVLLTLLTEHATSTPLDILEAEIRDDAGNELYEAHAEAHLLFAILCARAGEPVRARAAWRDAGRCLAAYGFRKDITLYGPIDALESCPDPLDPRVVDRLRRLQPLPNVVVSHTDGSETSHLPLRWFSAFARSSPGSAAEMLATGIRQHSPVGYWIHEDALERIAEHSHGHLPPELEHLLWRCISARGEPSLRLRPVADMLAAGSSRATEAYWQAVAAIDGDTEHPLPEFYDELRAFATEHGLPGPDAGTVPETRQAPDHGSSITDREHQSADAGPFLGDVTRLGQVYAWANEFDLDRRDPPLDADRLVAELEAKLDELGASDEQAVTVVRSLSRRSSISYRAHILIKLARRFQERGSAVAADLLVLAWCAGRTGMIEPFGGFAQRDLLQAAKSCDEQRARSTLALEIAHLVEAQYGSPLTRQIFDALVALDDLDGAFAIWDAAVEVIEWRLPEFGNELTSFLEAGPDLDSDGTRFAFAHLLVVGVRHPDLDRRAAAFAGLAEAVAEWRQEAAAMIEFIADADSAFTDLLAALQIAAASGQAGRSALAQSQDLVSSCARASGFALSFIAGRLAEQLGLDVNPPLPEQAARLPTTAAQTQQALRQDYADRAEFLAQRWYAFPRRVAEHFQAIWRGGLARNTRIEREQTELQYSRARSWVPPQVLHLWRNELYEIALQDGLDDLCQHLMISGEWRINTRPALHDITAPDAPGAAARGRSRITRPSSLSRPDQVEPGAGPPPMISSGPFAGWTVLGYHERQLVEVDYSHGQSTIVYAGLTSGDRDPDSLPWASGRGDFRWHRQQANRDTTSAVAAGPLLQWWVQHDAFAFDRGLTLRADVRTRLGLVAAPLPAAYDLIDADGETMIVWRRWWMRPHNYDYGPRTPWFCGGALLAGPAALEAIAGLVSTEATFHQQVEINDLAGPG
jgi:hypothetical protein